MGQLVIMGKIESGMCKKGTKLIMYPNKNKVEVHPQSLTCAHGIKYTRILDSTYLTR